MLDRPAQTQLSVTIGQYSSAGRKPQNQDFHGALAPEGAALLHKGIALAIADGISPSPVSHIAAETAVKSFLTDYYCTSEAWAVKTAASRVIGATNAWLAAQGAAIENRDHAYVTTFSALVLKAQTAHLFHIGDSRISRLAGDSLEPLTQDHRAIIAGGQGYLIRALGLEPSIEIDYRSLALAQGDTFVLTTDGVHGALSARDIVSHIARETDLDLAARNIVASALAAGSDDNLTIQILRVDALPELTEQSDLGDGPLLPPAPLPMLPAMLDGYRIQRELHASSRSHVYLATEVESGRRVAIKFPSVDLKESEAYLRRFAAEEWIARRIHSPHVLAAVPPPVGRKTLYTVTEYLDGQTLRQWMEDHPTPSLETVRDLVEQIGAGLLAFHRKDMIHQDLRPENVMIDPDGTARIIDFGAVRVAGVVEAMPQTDSDDILGTHQYAAPEYFAGQRGTEQSDLYSLGAIAYELLTGELPYGAAVAQGRRLTYRPSFAKRRDIPAWADSAVHKAVNPDPARRYTAISEFLYDLRHPNPTLPSLDHLPLAQRNPVRFWQSVSAILLVICVGLAWLLLRA
ncbi:bifunctional protein-serine/threonine kinase/phosphatase [Devosia sp. XJ19-1]|uniref:Bifunctional protein-serine/threonine kinase/phosphatase n=1 Tax=Devosia ureilytica TaxID=2952754 RepID=A0A9Q4APV2_9HYPH|nr:bifunctional protein-serine/threonine kinase/phosphatase [Devosia ureilytica]MCP8884314.1 bifunctional protein-serine/threonine kinase/phosphatase [Devosia ureilytica]MCP8887922.1 bifunctional protein-serine/threonine kinase/phosphatase [Devosia ureilytica]